MPTFNNPNPVNEVNRRRVVLALLGMPLFLAVLLFLPAGKWYWPKGWLFLLVLLGDLPLVYVVLWRVNPEVVIARSQPHEGTKRWDKILLCFYFPSMLATLPVAALDDGRFHWFPVPWWVCGFGYALLLVGIGLVTWAEAVNKFFEPTVRIQTDRGHVVVDSGPYAIVRHPGYVGAIAMAVGMALALGSLWALLPAGLASGLLVLRTQWEDQVLRKELQGYEEYTQRVRYKLLPCVW